MQDALFERPRESWFQGLPVFSIVVILPVRLRLFLLDVGASWLSANSSTDRLTASVSSLWLRLFSSLSNFPICSRSPCRFFSQVSIATQFLRTYLLSVVRKDSFGDYVELTESSAPSCGSHRELARLKHRVLVRIKLCAPLFGASCTDRIVYRVHVLTSRQLSRPISVVPPKRWEIPLFCNMTA